jgi:hypothetical protein
MNVSPSGVPDEDAGEDLGDRQRLPSSKRMSEKKG